MAVVTLDPTRRYEVDFRDVEYLHHAGETYLARICQPKGDGPFPLLMFVHGGAWNSGTRMNNGWLCEPLAASGMVVVSIDFGLAPAHPYPEPLTHINYGVRWAKAHAQELNADATRVGALGSSSGGHQSMMTALRPTDPRYAAIPMTEAPEVDASLAYVVGCWAILDPHARYLFAQETGREELVKRTENYFRTADAMLEGNPRMIVERREPATLPPTLIIQGTEDTNVTPALQKHFQETYRAAGGECELHVFEGMPHGTTQWPAKETEEALDLIRGFISRQLAQGGPTS